MKIKIKRVRGMKTGAREPTRQDVEQGEAAIRAYMEMIEDHCREKDLSVDVLISTMIAMIGRIIDSSARNNVPLQEEMIEFVTHAIRISLAENKSRPQTPDLEVPVPSWEKN